MIIHFAKIILLYPLLFTLIVVLNSKIIFADQRPNIVLILSDDQAWTDYGFMGHQEIRTPHLDELANKSLVFERGYVASPLCRPSLASMITGRYSFDHGVTGNDVDGLNQRAKKDIPVKKRFHSFPSFIKLLTDHGYLAHQSGKWWEGSWKEGGFTDGMTEGARHGGKGLEIGRKGLQPITDFIDKATRQNNPFFIWYAPFLPHTPHNPPKRLHNKYKKANRSPDVGKYYAMCEWFDETCGKLLDYLDHKKLTDNTLVIYICDNGWVPKSVHKGEPKGGIRHVYAPRSKASPYENGIRTPIMLAWPEKIKPAKSPELAHAIDLFPTIMTAANIVFPENLPGINLLDDDRCQQRNTVFGVSHSVFNMTVDNPDDTLQYLWAVEKDWKLIIRNFGTDTTKYKTVHEWDVAPVRLYAIGNDPQEQNDLAKTHPEIVQKLQKKILDWHPVSLKITK